MRLRKGILFTVAPLAAIIFFIFAWGRGTDQAGPKEVLDRYFTSAIRQDYAKTYACYSLSYKLKVSKDEYIRHRRDASVLLSYAVTSFREDGDTAQAEVFLTFGPSEKLKRKEPVSVTVKEQLIKEDKGWKIKV